MSDKNRLLVPMYMEALVLREDKTDCLNIRPRFDRFTQSLLGEALKPVSMVSKLEQDEKKLEKGVHLHWTLPKALKHSFVDEGADMKFPYVPNRWMVIRLQTNNGIDNIPARTWMVESDCVTDSRKKNWASITNDKLTFSSIGKAFDYPYTAGPNQASFLKAVGAANPFFSAFYPGCRNVFGFHDDMKDVPNDATMSYVVVGWYSNPADDPLAPVDDSLPTAQKEKKIRELEWFKQQWKYAGENYPESCLLHSSIHTVSWKNGIPNSGIPDGTIEVIAGNTSIEALSAKLRKNLKNENVDVEDLLNALQYQLLDDDHNQPGIPAIKNEIHKRSFNSYKGGNLWEITRVEATDKQLENSKEKRNHFPADPAILADLKQLNTLETEINTINRTLQSLRQEYYLLWYKQAQKVVIRKDNPVPNFNYESSRKVIRDQIHTNTTKLEEKQEKHTKLKDKLVKYPELSGSKREFELKEKPDDRFWEPNEPVVLLSDSVTGNLVKPAMGNETEIYCRTIDQLVDKLALDVPANSKAIPVSISKKDFKAAKLHDLKTTDVPADEIRSLTCESLLFSAALAKDIAMLAYRRAQADEGIDKAGKIIETFAAYIISTQQKILQTPILADAKKQAVRAPLPFAATKWSQAWSPLFMSWNVIFTPSNPQIKNLDIKKDNQWQLTDDLFYKNRFSGLSADDSLAIRFGNISPLSLSAYDNLKNVLQDHLPEEYRKPNYLSQSLSGLHKALLMQNPGIQLPPVIYNTEGGKFKFKTEYLIDQQELNVIGKDGYRLGSFPGEMDGEPPALSAFYPFRAGLLQIVSLSIIDAFGQVKQVISETDPQKNEVTCAGNMIGDSVTNHSIPLAPRFLQPARLQCYWLNNKEEVVYQDNGHTDNPVFGWVVPNFLDNSLMIYDGQGKEVVILQIRNDVSKEKGLYLEQNTFPGSDRLPDLADNPHLKRFIANISSGSIATGLIDLALKVNLNITGTNAMQHNTGALLCGQPLALARCSVQLGLSGLPAFNQRWDQSGKQNTGGIETVKIPVFFGDYNKPKDGLIGYFVDDEAVPHLYTTTNAPGFSLSESEPFFKSNTPVKISVDQGPVKMTLLLDPSAGVHISSGVLPTKFIELFPQNTGELLSSLNIGFMVAPFIAEKVAPGIPVPTSINANWKWTHRSDVTTWQKDADIAEGKNKQLAAFKKQQVYEGWLKSSNLKPNN